MLMLALRADPSGNWDAGLAALRIEFAGALRFETQIISDDCRHQHRGVREQKTPVAMMVAIGGKPY
jgi:hypothetical protein